MNRQQQTELTARERAIVPIAAFTASGVSESLASSLSRGLNAGLKVSEIKEILLQMYAYCGFPRSLNALGAFMNLLAERQQQGVTEMLYDDACIPALVASSLSIGTRNQTQLVGQAVTGALFDFAPEIDAYLKAHLFGDIFARDVLSWKERELATIAALANMSGVNSQLRAHYAIGLNNGLSAQQLQEFISILRQECGGATADNAHFVLQAVLA